MSCQCFREAFGDTHKVKTGVRLGKMSFRLVVVPKRASTYEFNLNCNNSTRLTSPTGEGLPSHDFKLK